MIRKTRVRARTDVPTSSLADIAFLLLIFFLVTTVFDEEKGLRLELPEDTIIEVSPENLMHLITRADGLVDVRQGENPNVRSVLPADLRAIWRSAVAEHPNLIAAVHVEGGATYRRMIDVLDELQSAGARRISLQLARQ